MWTPEHRLAAERSGLRYPSDLTDAEWAIVEPMIPPARHGGRKRSVNVREVLNGIFYILWTGCQWKALPKDLPPKSTVHDYLELWNWDGTLERIHHALYVAVREQEGREASPTVAIIDSQTAKGTQKGGLARSFGLRRGQEDQRSQAAHPGRHVGSPVERCRSSRRRSRPRWSIPSVGSGTPTVPLHQAHLCRRWLCGREDGARRVAHRDMEAGDCEATRGHRFRDLVQKMDRRKDIRLDQPQSSPSPRFRTLRHNSCRVRPLGHDPHYAKAACCRKLLVMNPNLPDGLLENLYRTRLSLRPDLRAAAAIPLLSYMGWPNDSVARKKAMKMLPRWLDKGQHSSVAEHLARIDKHWAHVADCSSALRHEPGWISKKARRREHWKSDLSSFQNGIKQGYPPG